MPRKPVFDVDDLRERVLEGIRAEKRARLEGLNEEEQRNVDTYYDFIEKHTNIFARNGKLWTVTENPYALVVLLRCPWYRCGTGFRVAKFLSEREGRAYFLVCPRCRQRVVTLRDTIMVFGTNTYPVKTIQAEMMANPAYETQCRKTLVEFLRHYEAWMGRDPSKVHDVVEETRDHRAITVRTRIEEDEDTVAHLNEGFRKRKIKDVWGIG